MTKETLGLRCTDTGCRPDEIGPVWIPSLGFEGTL